MCTGSVSHVQLSEPQDNSCHQVALSGIGRPLSYSCKGPGCPSTVAIGSLALMPSFERGCLEFGGETHVL